MASKHSRKVSNRASLLRQPTTGPLDADNNPITLPVLAKSSRHGSSTDIFSPNTPSRSSPLPRSPVSPARPSPSNYQYDSDGPGRQKKDLSFLLEPSFYLPIPQLDVPPQFRIQLHPILPSTPISELLPELDRLLSRGEFLSAAHVAAAILTSPALDPTDIKTIADLLSVRYSCLELTGNTLIAAQESKALEDLNSDFYYTIPPATLSQQSAPGTTGTLANHILPFSLRLQASRLQSIGFSDPRRAVSALYDLGLECREHIVSPDISTSERELWGQRLNELGVRVVNALIEINDLECAKRTLRSLGPSSDSAWKIRMCLLLLKLGDISAAKVLLKDTSETSAMLAPLLATAEGRFEDAIQEWENLRSQTEKSNLESVVQQNLAVNYLYAGRLEDARNLMENAVQQREGYKSLTFNLATIYELSSERSHDLKMSLAVKVATQDGTMLKKLCRVNTDFKL